MGKYLKAPPDPRGGHVRIYWEILDSPVWTALSWVERSLYVALRRKLKSTNNGNIEATLGSLESAGFGSSATLAKGLRALQAVGLLAKTRQGGIAAGGKECSLYRFTDVDVFDFPKQRVKAIKATNEWKQFATVQEALAALRDAHEAALRPSTKEKRKVRELNRTDSVHELLEPILGSNGEHDGSSRVHTLNKASSQEIGRRAS